jgi:hypothetical protein
MNKQEVINKVHQYFIVEKHPQSIEVISGQCRYRNPVGNKCAIGCLIPDSIYTKDMEALTVKSLLNRYPDVSRTLNIQDEDIEFLDALQRIHDKRFESFERELKYICNIYALEYPE